MQPRLEKAAVEVLQLPAITISEAQVCRNVVERNSLRGFIRDRNWPEQLAFAQGDRIEFDFKPFQSGGIQAQFRLADEELRAIGLA